MPPVGIMSGPIGILPKEFTGEKENDLEYVNSDDKLQALGCVGGDLESIKQDIFLFVVFFVVITAICFLHEFECVSLSFSCAASCPQAPAISSPYRARMVEGIL